MSRTHTTTFTAAGIAPWTPVLVTGDDLKRQTRTSVHELLGSGTPAVSFLPTLTRSGRFDIVSADAVDAALGLALLSSARPIALVDVDRPDLNMRLVVVDDVAIHTDKETQKLILMSVNFQEVPL